MQGGGKNALSLFDSAAVPETLCCSDYCFYKLHTVTETNSNGVTTDKTQPEQMYHVLCQYSLLGEKTGWKALQHIPQENVYEVKDVCMYIYGKIQHV